MDARAGLIARGDHIDATARCELSAHPCRTNAVIKGPEPALFGADTA
jgi:hypothetical protein